MARLCTVDGKHGLFHIFEQSGVYSKIYAIVEFNDGVRRVDPTKIRFCDETNASLSLFDETLKEDKND